MHGANTFALITDISHRLMLSNSAYEVGHTSRAFDDDYREVAGNCFYNVLKRPLPSSN